MYFDSLTLPAPIPVVFRDLEHDLTTIRTLLEQVGITVKGIRNMEDRGKGRRVC